MERSELLARTRAALDGHRLPLGVFNSREIFELERERIFTRSWCFLGHASEIPEPGDFVQRYIVDDAFLVTRGDDGRIRALLNACRHRGRQLCRAERGRARAFQCPYHGWVYRNDGRLNHVPRAAEVYRTEPAAGTDGHLLQAPRVEV